MHILTGPIAIEGAEPGDVLKVEILDLQPRKNPDGKTFGSNAAAWWGFQARVPLVNGTDFTAGSFTNTPTQNDEIVTIYEIMDDGNGGGYAVPSYQFEWPVITDPNGTTRNFIAYPGTCGMYMTIRNTLSTSFDGVCRVFLYSHAFTYIVFRFVFASNIQHGYCYHYRLCFHFILSSLTAHTTSPSR